MALRAVGELSRWLGDGLALVADVYDPDVVVIAGGVSNSAHLFLEEARRRYTTTVTGVGHRPLADVRVAKHGAEASVVGAAALAREHVAASVGRAIG